MEKKKVTKLNSKKNLNKVNPKKSGHKIKQFYFKFVNTNLMIFYNMERELEKLFSKGKGGGEGCQDFWCEKSIVSKICKVKNRYFNDTKTHTHIRQHSTIVIPGRGDSERG